MTTYGSVLRRMTRDIMNMNDAKPDNKEAQDIVLRHISFLGLYVYALHASEYITMHPKLLSLFAASESTESADNLTTLKSLISCILSAIHAFASKGLGMNFVNFNLIKAGPW